MIEVGAYEAKTHLPRLLERVQRGERALTSVLPLAHEHGLSVYDAAYLELALRRGLPLATLDRGLADACRAAGVEVLE